ncbi:hypothetical protein [Bifidobacterium olomucense]|uniref:Uncharacterized protein n=1 Tax=Bifidobacterium olomucense TaxID=2675324 RepID=A0A7Y0HX26_9BIFI|nr:hypothetical protein [Bifidobacterium sp. DSM 109959]NMM97519.1 hypothetical protein [Bifidobacterium sp. DSM 109959]
MRGGGVWGVVRDTLMVIAGLGLLVALWSIFGNPIEVVKAGANWVIWAVNQVADLLTGSEWFVDTVTTDPAAMTP